MLSFDEVKRRLPNLEFWGTGEVCSAFGVCRQSIERASRNHDLGKLLPTKGRGKRIYTIKDIEALCKILKGNPKRKV